MKPPDFSKINYKLDLVTKHEELTDGSSVIEDTSNPRKNNAH